MSINKSNYTEYTTEEIVEFAHSQQLCPLDWGLPVLPICQEGLDPNECKSCWKKALGTKTTTSPLALFENNAVTVLKDLSIIEKRYKDLTSSRDDLKVKLMALMEQYGITKFDNDDLSITYVAARNGTKFDTTKFKKDHPDLYEQYLKPSSTKTSVRFKTYE